jgi:hypothetical protein
LDGSAERDPECWYGGAHAVAMTFTVVLTVVKADAVTWLVMVVMAAMVVTTVLWGRVVVVEDVV